MFHSTLRHKEARTGAFKVANKGRAPFEIDQNDYPKLPPAYPIPYSYPPAPIDPQLVDRAKTTESLVAASLDKVVVAF